MWLETFIHPRSFPIPDRCGLWLRTQTQVCCCQGPGGQGRRVASKADKAKGEHGTGKNENQMEEEGGKKKQNRVLTDPALQVRPSGQVGTSIAHPHGSSRPTSRRWACPCPDQIRGWLHPNVSFYRWMGRPLRTGRTKRITESQNHRTKVLPIVVIMLPLLPTKVGLHRVQPLAICPTIHVRIAQITSHPVTP